MAQARKQIAIRGGTHKELERQKELIAEVLEVPKGEVTFDDAVRSLLYPVDWTGVHE